MDAGLSRCLLRSPAKRSVRAGAPKANSYQYQFRYESGGQLDNIGYWTTPEDWVDWEFKITKPGEFIVSSVISAPSSGVFDIASQTIRCAAPKTGDYFTFTPVKLGRVKISANGTMVLAVRPIMEGWQPMNLKGIRLDPATD